MDPNHRHLLLGITPIIIYFIFIQYQNEYSIWYMSYNNARLAFKRRKKVRVLWSDVNQRISDIQFRRMFRMNRQCFALLCQLIIRNVGEKQFKSEAYIDAFLKGKDSMYDANCKTTGGYISGEVKLAVTLRLLAGGDALDLGLIFDIGSNHCKY